MKPHISDCYNAGIREGKFLGKLISTDSKEHSKTYELKLPTDSLFAKVHGEVTLDDVDTTQKYYPINTINNQDSQIIENAKRTSVLANLK